MAALGSTRFDWDSDTVVVRLVSGTDIDADARWIPWGGGTLELELVPRALDLPNLGTGLLISDLTTDGPFYSEAEDWLLDSWLEEHDDGM